MVLNLPADVDRPTDDGVRCSRRHATRLQGHIGQLHMATHTGRRAATRAHQAATHGYTHRTLGGYRDTSSGYTWLHTPDSYRGTSSDYTLPLLHMATHIGRRAATGTHRGATHGYTHRTPGGYRDTSSVYTRLHTPDAGRLQGHIERLHTATHIGRWAATGTHRASTHGYTHRTLGGYRDTSSGYTRLHTPDAGRLQGHIERLHTATHTGRWAATGTHRATTRCHCYTWLHTSDAGRLHGHIERLHTATHIGRRAVTLTHRATTHGYTHRTLGGYMDTSSVYTRLHTPDAGRLHGHIERYTRLHTPDAGRLHGHIERYTRLHTPDAGRLHGHIKRLHTATHTGRWAATWTHRAVHTATHTGRRAATRAHRAVHMATHTGRWAATWTHRASTHGYTHRTPGGYRDISSGYTRLHTPDAGRLQGHIERLHMATHTGRRAATGTHRAATHGYTHRTPGGYRETSGGYTHQTPGGYRDTWVIPCQFIKFLDVFPRTPSDCFEIWYGCRTW